VCKPNRTNVSAGYRENARGTTQKTGDANYHLSPWIFITTEPNDLIQPIHNRMPAILRPEDEEQWLDASRTTFAKAKSLLKPYPEELMDAHDVSPIVNSAKYDCECVRPVSDSDMPRTGQ
jgi:putative SOS response-associated peptidase YedK